MKRTYHTNVRIRFVMGLLTSEQCKEIPTSTRSYWMHHTDLNKIFGITDTYFDVNSIRYFLKKKYLVKVMYAVMPIEIAFHKILESIPERSRLLKECSEFIISVIDNVKHITGFERALKVFMISKQQYYFWRSKKVCMRSPLNLCRRIFYNQLSNPEISTIKAYLNDEKTFHWSLNSIYYKMLRNHAAFMSISTFYKYSNLLGLSKLRRLHRKPQKKGFKALKPLEYIHMDVTEVKIKNNIKVYISFVSDNLSKCLLGWHAATTKKSVISVTNMNNVIKRFDINKSSLVVDGGSENKGKLNDFLFYHKIRKLLAQSKEFVYSNSSIEAINKKFKYEYLREIQILHTKN